MRSIRRNPSVSCLVLAAIVAVLLLTTGGLAAARPPAASALQTQTLPPQATPTASRTPAPRMYLPVTLKQRPGKWAGRTSDGTPIEFYVTRGGTAIEDVTLRHIAHCPWTSSVGQTTYLPGPIPIVNGTFVFEWEQGIIYGSFTSQDWAEGSWGLYWVWADYYQWPCRSAGNWLVRRDASLTPWPTPTPWMYPSPRQ